MQAVRTTGPAIARRDVESPMPHAPAQVLPPSRRPRRAGAGPDRVRFVLMVVAALVTASAAPAGAEDAEREDVAEDGALVGDDGRELADDARVGAYPGALPPGLAGAPPPSAPAIAEVLEAAYAAAGLADVPARGWRRRARLGGLVPWLTVRTGWDASWKQDDPTIDRGRTFEVRATWRLDRLVFDGRELQIATIDAARRRERRRLASRVIRLYFAWRRYAAAAAAHPRWGPRAEEAAAELDAITDGWFSERRAEELANAATGR